MTRDEIISMAREAGLSHFYDSEGHCTGVTDAVLVHAENERNDKRLIEILAPFAALVAAAERQRIEDLLLEQHEMAKDSHNYWQVAAEWIQVGSDT